MITKLLVATAFGTAALLRTAAAASIVTPAPLSVHPTQTVAITGSGFAASEAVDVYLDTTDALLLVSSATGTLTGSVTIPASAAPGPHSITAIGRRSSDAAQHALAVSTPWLQFGYGLAHASVNPFENTLSTSTAPTLGTLWSLSPAASWRHARRHQQPRLYRHHHGRRFLQHRHRRHTLEQQPRRKLHRITNIGGKHALHR